MFRSDLVLDHPLRLHDHRNTVNLQKKRERARQERGYKESERRGEMGSRRERGERVQQEGGERSTRGEQGERGERGTRRERIRSHCGSRTNSVQVNIVAVSAHVFHSSLLVPVPCVYTFLLLRASCFLAPCLNRTLLMHLAHLFLTSPMQVTSLNFGQSNGPGSDLEGMAPALGVHG